VSEEVNRKSRAMNTTYNLQSLPRPCVVIHGVTEGRIDRRHAVSWQ